MANKSGQKGSYKKSSSTSQNKFFDYSRIQKLKEESWANPKVQENWKKYYQRLKENKKIKNLL